MKCTQQTILITLAFAKYDSDDLDNFGNTSFMHIHYHIHYNQGMALRTCVLRKAYDGALGLLTKRGERSTSGSTLCPLDG